MAAGLGDTGGWKEAPPPSVGEIAPRSRLDSGGGGNWGWISRRLSDYPL